MRLALHAWSLPLLRPVRGRETRRGWLLELEDLGRTGWGEAACWPGFGSGVRETRRALGELIAAPARLDRALAAARAGELEDAGAELAAIPSANARAAAEVAILDLVAREQGRSLAALLWPAPRESVAIHALVDGAAAARAAVKAGVGAVKLKVGGADDLRCAREVRDAIGPTVGLRLDGNGAWSAPEALERVAALAAAVAPEWIEQPVAPGDLAGLAALRARSGVRVAVDEGVRDLADLEAHLRAGALDVLVIKPQAAGGLLPARALAERARAAGLEVVLTHALESAVGRAAGLALAAGLPGRHGLGPALAVDLAALPPVLRGAVALPPALTPSVTGSLWRGGVACS